MKIRSLLLVTLAILGLTASTMAQNLPNYVPSNGLVGWWPFNGNANDESGNGNDGVNYGAVLTLDRFNNENGSYLFENDSIQLNNSSNFNIDAFTISAWIKTNNENFNNPYQTVFSYHTGSGFSNYSGYWIGLRGNQADLFLGNGNSFIDILSNSVVNDGNWHFITGIYEGGVGTIYVDGVQENSGNFVMVLSAASPVFGNDFLTEIFYGKIDDIAIWNRALIPEEILAIYKGEPLLPTSILSESSTNTIKVYPNPAASFLSIDYGNFALMSGYQLRIENSLGQEVFQTKITQQSDYLNLSTWGGNGLYFVHIIDAQGNTIDIRKIVLQ